MIKQWSGNLPHHNAAQSGKTPAHNSRLQELFMTTIVFLSPAIIAFLLELLLSWTRTFELDFWILFVLFGLGIAALLGAVWQTVWLLLAIALRTQWLPQSFRTAVGRTVDKHGSAAARRVMKVGVSGLVASGVLLPAANADSGQALWPNVDGPSASHAEVAAPNLWADSLESDVRNAPADDIPGYPSAEVGDTLSSGISSSAPQMPPNQETQSSTSTKTPLKSPAKKPTISSISRPAEQAPTKLKVPAPTKRPSLDTGVLPETRTLGTLGLGTNSPVPVPAVPYLPPVGQEPVASATPSREASGGEKETRPVKMPSSYDTVRVQAGDSLWMIAADTMVSPNGTDADIDVAWRALYASNFNLIGEDPNVIHPGMVLTVPEL